MTNFPRIVILGREKHHVRELALAIGVPHANPVDTHMGPHPFCVTRPDRPYPTLLVADVLRPESISGVDLVMYVHRVPEDDPGHLAVDFFGSPEIPRNGILRRLREQFARD